MAEQGPKADLHHYLQMGREVLLWKLEGLSEYDIRRPMVPTGTNLLGLVKHVAGVEVGYFGEVFGRPFPEHLPWLDEASEPRSDMWAAAGQTRDDIVALYRRVWAHSDATIEAVPLEATGLVPWWPEDSRHPTLHRVLVHVIAETHRHAGHSDIVRELIDGSVGHREGVDNMGPGDAAWFKSHRERLRQAALQAAKGGGSGTASRP